MTTETLIGDAPTNVAAPTQDAQTPTVSAAEASASNQQTPASDAATPQEAPAGDTSDEAASAKPERAAPEKYEFRMPEGTTLDSEVLAEFESTARELGMPQEEAQKLMEKLAPKIAARQNQQQAELIDRASSEWTAAATADKEYGGDKLAENLALGEKALTTFGTPALRQLLVDSRFGNHPEVIRFMVRAGKALSEDTFVPGGTKPPAAAKSAANVLYPNQQ